MKKVSIATMAAAFMMCIATSPTYAAGEDGNTILPAFDNEVRAILDSVTKENPDAHNCNITITVDFEKDTVQDMWVAKQHAVSATPATADGVDAESSVDNVDNDPEANTDEDESSGGMSKIIIWILALAIVGILVKLFLPKMRKQQKRQTPSTPEYRQESNRHNAIPNAPANHPNVGGQSVRVSPLPPPYPREKEENVLVKEKDAEEDTPVILMKETETEPKPKPAPKPKPIVKYGQIAVLSQDELVTENDYMTAEEAGMPFEFTFTPAMTDGTYDLTPASRQSFLRDLSMLRPYVQDFDVIPNPKAIRTISKGRLAKRGMQWVITEKAKIELQ